MKALLKGLFLCFLKPYYYICRKYIIKAFMETNKFKTTTFEEIKDQTLGEIGTEKRDTFERESAEELKKELKKYEKKLIKIASKKIKTLEKKWEKNYYLTPKEDLKLEAYKLFIEEKQK